MALPRDPIILLSYVNTKLRDRYASLEEFCAEEGIDCETLCEQLASIHYEYNRELNCFC